MQFVHLYTFKVLKMFIHDLLLKHVFKIALIKKIFDPSIFLVTLSILTDHFKWLFM